MNALTLKPNWRLDRRGDANVWRTDADLGAGQPLLEVGPHPANRSFYVASAKSLDELHSVVQRICAKTLQPLFSCFHGLTRSEEEALDQAEAIWRAGVETGEGVAVARKPKILVLTQCTGRKEASGAPAERLYRGHGHLTLMEGVDLARAAGVDVEVKIISAKYGMVDGDRLLEPYDQTFSGKSDGAKRGAGAQLGLPKAVETVIEKTDYDLAIVTLGRDYMIAAGAEYFLSKPSAPVIVLTGGNTMREIGQWVTGATYLQLGALDLSDFGAAHVNLKGTVAATLLRAAGRLGIEAVIAAAGEGQERLRQFSLANGST